MFIDFENSSIHLNKLLGIIGAMEDNAKSIGNLPTEIAPVFGGVTADAHEEITHELNKRLINYTSQLTQLKNAAMQQVGHGGEFQTSDQISAKDFGAGAVFS